MHRTNDDDDPVSQLQPDPVSQDHAELAIASRRPSGHSVLMQTHTLLYWAICVLPALSVKGEKSKTPYDLELPDIAVARKLVRDAAQHVEAQYVGVNADAQGLAQRVKDILATPEPLNGNNDDTRTKLKVAMTQVVFSFSFATSQIGNGFSGYELDTSSATRRRQLVALAGSTASGFLQDWEREAALYDLSDSLGLKTEREEHLDRLVQLCRLHLKTNPSDAAGHAMLADALAHLEEEELPAAKAAAETALGIQKDNLGARLVLLQLECLRWLDLARGPANEAESRTHDVFLDRLIKNAMAETEFDQFANVGRKLAAQADALMTDAAADLVLLLRSAGLRVWVLSKIKQAEISRRPDTPRNTQAVQTLAMLEMPTYFLNHQNMESALRLADKNIEAYGAIFLSWLKSAALQRLTDPTTAAQGSKDAAIATMLFDDTTTGKRKESKFDAKLDLGAENQAAVERVVAHLRSWLKTGSDIEKARIHEVICRAEMIGLLGGRFQLHVSHLTDGLRADPERHVLWSFLIAINEASWEDVRLGLAILELQLALDPTIQQRRYCAAFADRLQMWQRAEAFIEQSLKETPDDYALWNQKAVLSLRQDSSDDGIKKAEVLFEKAKDLLRRQGAAFDENRLTLTKNCILFEAMQGRWDEALETAESYQKHKLMPSADAESLLKTLRELKPAK